MGLFRALINNTFFVLLLLVAVTFYIAFSDDIKKDHGIETQTQQEVEKLVSSAQANTEVQAETVVEEQPDPKEELLDDLHKNATKETAHNPSTEVLEKVETAKAVESKKVEATKTETAKKQAESSEVTAEATKESTPLEQASIKAKSARTEKSATPKGLISKEEAKAVLKAYASPKAAVDAALMAYQNKDYSKAEKILFALSMWRPTPEILGALGNVFYADHKLDWAKRAWAAAVSQLIQHGQFKAALHSAEKLKSIASDLSKEIQQKVQKAQTQS